MPSKFVVTNVAALTAKYGVGGVSTVQAAIARLITADAARGLTTRLVDLSDAAQMAGFGGNAISATASPADCKAAIDVVATPSPDYLLLLGAPDVVPHQPMINLTPQDGPVRVVGRLPDVAGAGSPEAIVDLIDIACGWSSSARAAYANYFGLTAAAWLQSTQLSLTNTFGSSTNLFESPPIANKAWNSTQLAPLSHFVNCHGGTIDPQWYGDPGFPIAMDSTQVATNIPVGAVAAAECCYGAELYDPNNATAPAICTTYLADGAYAFFGSTTIAYGPAAGNSAADLICQYFLQEVLSGASTGRAALDARLKFVLVNSPLSPIDLKTLGQFLVLGDPSIHPVSAPSPYTKLADKSGVVAENSDTLPGGTGLRRRSLVDRGQSASRTTSYASSGAESPQPALANRLYAVARDFGIDDPEIRTHAVMGPSNSDLAGSLGDAIGPKVRPLSSDEGRFHVAYSAKGSQQAKAASLEEKGRIPSLPAERVEKLLVFREIDGVIVDYQELWCHG